MEDPNNILYVCKDCIEKMYPNKGLLKVGVGEFAKIKFTDENGSEYMWVKVTVVDKEKGEYEGILDNDPVIVECVKYGDNVSFKKDDIFDAMVITVNEKNM